MADPPAAGDTRAEATRTDAGPPVRWCFAAAHVALADGYRDLDHRLDRPGSAAAIAAHVDWDATMALRTWLDGHGFGIAEAMDTAQRFFLGWDTAEELIARTGALPLRHGFCAGAGTDHLPAIGGRDDLVAGVVHQCRVIAGHGGIPVILPMPWLSRNRCPAADYVATYTDIVQEVDGPLFVHWLGPMFLPDLAGYFPDDSLSAVMAIDRDKVRGVKLSLLDAQLELRVRRELLPHDQIVLTGDDFHFSRLILGGDVPGDGARGDGAPGHGAGERPVAAPVERTGTLAGRPLPLGDFSHALLGAFDAIAAPAGLAFRALQRGDAARYLELMAPCEDLSRHVFAAPTQHYKAGLAFLAWIAGRQPNAMLVNREELLRDRDHYRRAAELAFACGAVAETVAARDRLQRFLDGETAGAARGEPS